ncbi:dephospho-CoA kinase [Oscillatoriales cyanobacterium LEGE 11467]|uniref:Dephospho-CoA kinase n=1 Tax=Zarconia navalis LEGE 11467 TaxID=1828826 RepID=A0A928VVL1_9CYAN|nr:dephospho-CoA kinase [Zarconia navalis]MBE9041052.1 dephospho-CoA kinase [Zarconia navalis LEGE 11467]
MNGIDLEPNASSRSDRASWRIIGLTGGIATGKSTVANYLAQTYHLPVLDADIFAREAVEPPSPILEQIRQRYGDTILQADGTLDRPELGAIVFDRPEERQWLEGRIHPYVRRRFEEAISNYRKSDRPMVLAIPLLFEARMTDLVSEIWVVSCSRIQQQERLMKRDRLTREQAIARIESQMPTAEKCDRANWVLDNSSTPHIWIEQLKAALR